jgi:hypothetical protein
MHISLIFSHWNLPKKDNSYKNLKFELSYIPQIRNYRICGFFREYLIFTLFAIVIDQRKKEYV